MPADDAGSGPEAVKRVVEEHGRYVWRTLRYLGVSASDVEDLCQEVFLVVHRKLGGFEGRSAMTTWLHGICLKVAAGHRRRAAGHLPDRAGSAERVDLVSATASSSSGEMDAAAARAFLRQVLGRLDERRRAAFVLHEIEGLPVAEVARVLGCPERTAYWCVAEARKEIRRLWEQAAEVKGPR